MNNKQFGPMVRSSLSIFSTLLNLRLELLKKQVIGKMVVFTIVNDSNYNDVLYQITGIIKNVYVTKNSEIVFVFDKESKFIKNTYTQNFQDGFVYSLIHLIEFNPDKEHVVNKSWESGFIECDQKSIYKKTISTFEVL